MTWGRHLLTNLDRHPAWATLGWETRGMALALMTRLAGAEGTDAPAWWDHPADGAAAHRGTLPNRPDTWRAVLGLPSRTMLQGAVTRTVAGRGSRTEILALDAAWTDAWLPELMNWFRVIDDAFLKDHPEYRAEAGRVWHPLLDCGGTDSSVVTGAGGATEGAGSDVRAQASAAAAPEQQDRDASRTADRSDGISTQAVSTQDAPIQAVSTPPRRARSRKKTAPSDGAHATGGPARVTATTTSTATPGVRRKRASAKKSTPPRDVVQALWDVGPWRPTLHALERAWDPPLPGSAQARLWDDGATYLSDGTKEGAAKVRSIVGRLIKEYGEAAVAQGLASVMTRPARPADPVAFLRKTVHAVVHGSPAEERARAQRAKVPL